MTSCPTACAASSRTTPSARSSRAKISSSSPVELAEAALEAIGRRDHEKLIELSQPDVEWHSLFAGLERRGVYHGHEGARQYMADLDEAWEVGTAEVDDALGVAETAVLVGQIHYLGRGSGVENRTPVVWVVECRDGKVARFRAYRDPEKVLREIGQAP